MNASTNCCSCSFIESQVSAQGGRCHRCTYSTEMTSRIRAMPATRASLDFAHIPWACTEECRIVEIPLVHRRANTRLRAPSNKHREERQYPSTPSHCLRLPEPCAVFLAIRCNHLARRPENASGSSRRCGKVRQACRQNRPRD